MHSDLALAFHLLPMQLWNTVYMVVLSTIFATLLGLPTGVILTITDHGHLKEHPLLHRGLGTIVNLGRSFPFAILMVTLIPFTRWLIGTSLGTTASIVPLTIAAIPFVARVVEASLKAIDRQLIEAAIVMGSSTWQMITKVLLQEALPSLVSGIVLTMVSLVGYSAMAGLVGGGGLGQVAIQYGYNRFNTTIMVTTILLLVLLVQGTQWGGNQVVKRILKRRGMLSCE